MKINPVYLSPAFLGGLKTAAPNNPKKISPVEVTGIELLPESSPHLPKRWGDSFSENIAVLKIFSSLLLIMHKIIFGAKFSYDFILNTKIYNSLNQFLYATKNLA